MTFTDTIVPKHVIYTQPCMFLLLSATKLAFPSSVEHFHLSTLHNWNMINITIGNLFHH